MHARTRRFGLEGLRLRRRRHFRVLHVFDLRHRYVRDYRLQRRHQPRVRGLHGLLGAEHLHGIRLHREGRPGLCASAIPATATGSTGAAAGSLAAGGAGLRL